MAFSLKHLILLLVAAVAVCIKLNDAQFIPSDRCLCHNTVRRTSENITDFQIIQRGPSCDTTQVIITIENSNNRIAELCLNTQGLLAKAFIKCWNRIKKDDSKKVTCLNKSNMRRAQARVTDIHA
ncbi:unnamed protein product [Arctogadus glacialis]